MADTPEYPVSNIKWILHACAADEALRAGDSRYYDFTDLRGGSSVVTELADTLEQHCVRGDEPDKANEYHHQILCGHRGAGKSTELLELRKWANENGFLCIWMDMETYFGSGELHYADFFLIAAEQIVLAMKNEANAPMPDEELQAVREWFHEVTLEDKNKSVSSIEEEAGAKLKGGVPLLVELFANFKAKREDSTEHLKTVRNKVRQNESSLVDYTRKLMEAATKRLEALKSNPRTNGLLLIFDSMDKYEQDNIEKLLHVSSSLRRLACHVVYTMHINLMYKPKTAYWDNYNTPVVLPMLALRNRAAIWKSTIEETDFNKEAVEEILAALNKRIVVGDLFEDPEDARLLVKMSGGCLRDLMHLVNIARKKSRVRIDQSLAKLTKVGVANAIAEYRLTLTEGLEKTDYTRLVEVVRQKAWEDKMDEPIRNLLTRRVVLRYAKNGIRWTDVHPLVIETEGFQHALRENNSLAS